MSSPPFLLLLGAWASAEPLQMRPNQEPTVLAARPELGPGVVRVRFPGTRTVELDVLPAAVIALRPGAAIPDRLAAEGEPLGASRRSWRVAGRPGENGVDVARRWMDDPAVASVVPDLLLARTHRGALFDDPRYPSQWYLELLQMPLLYAVELGAPEIRIAVIDSGIELDHPDLADAFVDPYDAFSDDDDPSPDPGEFCASGTAICDSHGTSVSGIVGARADNAEGIGGLCPQCLIVPIKLLGDGMGAFSADVAAFEHAIDADVAVINNSWGYTESFPVPAPLAAVIERAATEPRGGLGAVVVFAAGNDDREILDDELEALPTVVCVSATDSYGVPTAYTNYGATVDVAAPSATVTTTIGGDYTETFGGTSAAAPVVSGISGWMLSVDPTLSAADVYQLLIETAIPSWRVTADEEGHHDVYGYGELSPVSILTVMSATPETGDTAGPVVDDTQAPPLGDEPRACGCASTPTPAAEWLALAAGSWILRRRSRAR
jgi:hypothetical protein